MINAGLYASLKFDVAPLLELAFESADGMVDGGGGGDDSSAVSIGQVNAVRNMIEPILRYLSPHPPLSITPGERRAEHDRADPQRAPADAAAGCVRGGKHRYLVITPMATAAECVRGRNHRYLVITPWPLDVYVAVGELAP